MSASASVLSTAGANYLGKVLADPLSVIPKAQHHSVALAKITELVLKGNGIEAVRPDTFKALHSLTSLWLDHNKLSSCENIDHPFTMKKLYLSHNKIVSIESLSVLSALEHLDLSYNSINRLDTVLDSIESMLQLRILRMEGNPVAQEPAYRLRVIARMPDLHSLDNHVVTAVELRQARLGFGHTATGLAAKDAGLLKQSWSRTMAEVSAARALDSGSAFDRPRPDIRFGGEFETTISADTRREVASIHAKRQDEALSTTRRGFEDSAARSTWGGQLTDAASGRLGTGLPGDPRPVYVTSALINLAQPWTSEDVSTTATRLGMLVRGVEPDLLRLDRMMQPGPGGQVGARREGRRASLAERMAETSASIAMLNALAPVLETRHASHPLLGSPLRPEGRPHTSQSAAAGRHASTSPHPALSATLRAIQASHPIMPESQVLRTVMTSTGVRLKASRDKEITLSRYGLDAHGSLQKGAVSSDSKYTFEGKALPPHVPVLPALMPSGRLGEWDKWKLASIFKEADADGSGELTRDEIRTCLSACSDYGFCVDLGSEGEAEGSSTTAMLGTAGAQSAAGIRRLAAVLDKIFEAIDEDGSGTLTWREFLNALEAGKVEKKAGGKNSSASSKTVRPTSAGSSKGGKVPVPALSSPGAAQKALAGSPAKAVAVPTKRPAAETAQAAEKMQSVMIPQLRFRCLSSEEASVRAARYWKVAGDAWKRLQDYPVSDPYREQNMSRLHRDMISSSHKATRLDDIAHALGGAYDPPEKAELPKPLRADWVRFSSVVPTMEENKRHQRGGRQYKVPYPGDEVDRDEMATGRLLHPNVSTMAVELDDETGTMTLKRQTATKEVLRTLGNDTWERHRLKAKAREPHTVSQIKRYF